MKTRPIFLLGLGCFLAAPVSAQSEAPLPEVAPSPGELTLTLRTPEELDELLGPVALYPDALIALILPAAAAPTDIVIAARYLDNNGSPDALEAQPWDESVRALAHYPDVIQWMDSNLAWTRQIGEAFVAQPTEVMQSVQRLRARARATGALQDTPQQRVLLDVDAIRIVPADPEVIYVPYYDPQIVYVERPVYRPDPFITFGFGFAVGSWLRYDCDWHHRRIWVVNPHWHWHSHRHWYHDRFNLRFSFSDHRYWRPWTPPRRHHHWHNVHPDRDRDRGRDRDRDRPRREVVLPAPFPGRPRPSANDDDRGTRFVDRDRNRDRDDSSRRNGNSNGSPRSVVNTPTNLVTNTPAVTAPSGDPAARNEADRRGSRSGRVYGPSDRDRDDSRGRTTSGNPPPVRVATPTPAPTNPPRATASTRSTARISADNGDARRSGRVHGNTNESRPPRAVAPTPSPAPARVRANPPPSATAEAPRRPAQVTQNNRESRPAPAPRVRNNDNDGGSNDSRSRTHQENGTRRGRVYGNSD